MEYDCHKIGNGGKYSIFCPELIFSSHTSHHSQMYMTPKYLRREREIKKNQFKSKNENRRRFRDHKLECSSGGERNFNCTIIMIQKKSCTFLSAKNIKILEFILYQNSKFK